MEAEAGKRVLAAAAAAFLERRLHHQRMRVAALRALKSVAAVPGDRLQLDFDDGSGILEHAAPWSASSATEVAPSGAPRQNQYLAPRLNLVIMIVGSRGDVQPFIPIGKRIAWRHRVRIATHAEFRPMVERAGLEPMEYMVRTEGRIVPTHLQRQMIAEILESTWRASKGTTANTRGSAPRTSTSSAPTGSSSAMVAPAANRRNRSALGPTRSWAACGRLRETCCYSRVATSCACWPPAGSGSTRRPVVFSAEHGESERSGLRARPVPTGDSTVRGRRMHPTAEPNFCGNTGAARSSSPAPTTHSPSGTWSSTMSSIRR